MSITISLTGDWLSNFGNRNRTAGTGNLGVYATNGIAVSATNVGLSTIETFVANPAGGYTFEYVPSTGKVKAYYSATAAGTIDATSATVTVVGGQSAGPALQITPDSTGAVVGKTTATNRSATLPIAGITFTGSGAGVLTEVTNGVDLASTTFTWSALGR